MRSPSKYYRAMIRTATLDDLDALLALENRCFDSDRLSRRSFRRMITKAKSELLVDVEGNQLRAYALVLFHAGTPMARLYSVAVDPDARGLGLGRTLMQAVEKAALERDCIALRLEVRRDNSAALKLYAQLGYRQFGIEEDYYEDHMDAVRMEKSLVPRLPNDIARVPYYEQTLDFTCGPASLLMAMRALDDTLSPDRKLELRLWREATTIYMASGLGGCGPYGLALAAHHRGFEVEVWVDGTETELFVDSVRSEDKKEVIRLVQEDLLGEMREHGIPLHQETLSIDDLQRAFEDGGIPVVLISSWRIYARRSPHWVVVTGFDERFIYVHDPFVDTEEGKARVDCINIPILKKEFAGMARYGKRSQRAAIVIRRRT